MNSKTLTLRKGGACRRKGKPMSLSTPSEVADILIRDFGFDRAADYALKIYRRNPKTEIGQCYAETWQIIHDRGQRNMEVKLGIRYEA